MDNTMESPIAMSLKEVRELRAELSEMKVRAKMFDKQVQMAIASEYTIETSKNVNRLLGVGDVLANEMKELQKRILDWADKAYLILREREFSHMTAEELLMAHELFQHANAMCPCT